MKGIKKKKVKAPSEKLTPKEELFCRLYAQNRSLFGNGTQCYAQAYGYDLENLSRQDIESDPDAFGVRKTVEDSPYKKAVNICGVSANMLLRKSKIDARIAVLLREMLTPEQADTEMSYVMLQRTDLSAKNAAMREYNKMMKRTTEKVEIDLSKETVAVITGMEIIRESKETPVQN